MSKVRDDTQETIEIIYLKDKKEAKEVKQVYDENKDIDLSKHTMCKVDGIHYISWTFGPIFAMFLIGCLTFIPMHNPLEEHEYWWEFLIFMASGHSFLLAVVFVICPYYWLNVTNEFFSLGSKNESMSLCIE